VYPIRQHFIAATALGDTSADCFAGPQIASSAGAARAAFSRRCVLPPTRLVAVGIHLPQEAATLWAVS
jgi:hypothetical protein